MVSALLWLFNTVVFLYVAVVIVMMIMSWLTGLKVVDPHGAFVAQFDRGLYAITNPLVDPVRRWVPSMGGIDLSPVVVVLLLECLRLLVDNLVGGVGSARA
jgi:YggT family protein